MKGRIRGWLLEAIAAYAVFAIFIGLWFIAASI